MRTAQINGHRIALQVEVLVEGGDAGISDEHVGIVV